MQVGVCRDPRGESSLPNIGYEKPHRHYISIRDVNGVGARSAPRVNRIYLSPPYMAGNELENIKEAFDTNWIAPLGPHVNRFEAEMCTAIGAKHACAVSSGTGALHLALLMLGVKPGAEVYCSTLTFAATAYAVTYVGAKPVFVDCDRESWNMDPHLLEHALLCAAKNGTLPQAVIVVDLYGQCADYDAIDAICSRYEIPIIEDAAEALGATYKDKYAGTFGEMAVLSFNGNKIITTSGGGMLLTPHEKHVKKALHLATQARDCTCYYHHSEIGYNYRMSNVLAGIGRAQLAQLDAFVDKRRANFNYYAKHLGDLPGVEFMPEASYGRCSRWLTCLTIDPPQANLTAEDVRLHLETRNIESRPVWKPMHRQPVFRDARVLGGSVSDSLFQNGLCLPSGSALSEDELSRIVMEIRSLF